MPHFTGRLEIDDDEIEVEVTYTVTPHMPAIYGQPEEGGEVELLVVTRGGKYIAITDEQVDELIRQAEDHASELRP